MKKGKDGRSKAAEEKDVSKIVEQKKAQLRREMREERFRNYLKKARKEKGII